MAAVTTLPAAFVANTVLTADQMNNLRGAFRVLQVVSGTTSTNVSSSTATMVDTGLTATITPSSSSSQILVFANHPGSQKSNGSVNNALLLKLFRGSTLLAFNNSIGAGNGAAAELIFSTSFVYLDSPATTSATTYKTQFSNAVASAVVNVQYVSIPSNIILMEISA